eukprot:TRINITY_DN870_c3_g1_i2.p1 TRINITY_DN870_c3_g1~~TRINITY_DN870_c3_g1_i2.p1  ORF type:complete len:163 (+),score=71.07 TRINITY_DN870_c3_g1_i2:69-491(+)
MADLKVITRDELAKHNTKDDLWLLICGRVYDVTDYMDNHPGGVDRLLAVAPPQDATHEWRRFEGGGHSKGARMKMRSLLKGTIEGGVSDPEHDQWIDPAHAFDRETLNKKPAAGGGGSNTMQMIAVFVLVLAVLYAMQMQ